MKILKEFRKWKKLSLRELENISKVTHGYISRVENLKSFPSPGILKQLCNALNLNNHLYLIIATQFKEEYFKKKGY